MSTMEQLNQWWCLYWGIMAGNHIFACNACVSAFVFIKAQPWHGASFEHSLHRGRELLSWLVVVIGVWEAECHNAVTNGIN